MEAGLPWLFLFETALLTPALPSEGLAEARTFYAHCTC